MKTNEVRFKNSRGNILAGKLDMPFNEHISSYAVFAHCFTCSMELKAILNINRALTKHGIAVLRFDMTGIGSSQGNFPDTNFTTQIDDIVSASRFLKEKYSSPKLFIGHSLGGSAILFASRQVSSVQALVSIASPEEPSNLAIKLKRTKDRSVKMGVAETEIGGVKFSFKPQFFSDIEKYDAAELQKDIHLPYLVMHSNADTYSDVENGFKLFKRANQPKSFVSLDEIDHLMLRKEDANYVGEVIAAWSGKYLVSNSK
ncbi:MAG TPA: alpha/beta fold hydrolase [Ignavibacteria bacterium]|nr:alpha/beta fold hydrolase [Ignavibacteria bacterium]